MQGAPPAHAAGGAQPVSHDERGQKTRPSVSALLQGGERVAGRAQQAGRVA